MKSIFLSSFCLIFTTISIFGQSNSNVKQIGTKERFQNINLKTNSKALDFEQALKSASSYKVLNLSNNNLEYLDRRINEFVNVEYIDCSNNQLTGLPDELANLQKLKKIKLSNNKFNIFPDVLYKIPNLELIDISSNELSNVSINLSNYRNLKTLDFSKNQISQFNIYGNNQKFIELQLNNCGLNTIPSSIFKISSLKILGLSENNITHISPEILQLQNLQKIDLSKNQITNFDSDIFGLQKLAIVDLSHNKLSSFIISGSIPTNITELILGKNNISIFSSNNLSKLKFLDISFQNSKLIVNLEKCPNLEILDISGNIDIQLQGIENLSNITEFDYLNAELQVFPAYICNFSRLKKLNLAYNNIKTIPNGISNLTELEHLILSGNQISYLPESFCSLQKIKWVWLDHNNLSSLPNNLTKLSSLKLLSIKKNQFSDNQKEKIIAQLPKNVRVSF